MFIGQSKLLHCTVMQRYQHGYGCIPWGIFDNESLLWVTLVLLPWGKPQQLRWADSDMGQLKRCHKSELICEDGSGLVRKSAFNMRCDHQTCPSGARSPHLPVHIDPHLPPSLPSTPCTSLPAVSGILHLSLHRPGFLLLARLVQLCLQQL